MTVDMVNVSLVPPFPENGFAATLIRTSGPDMAMVDKATSLLGLTKAQFLRLCVVRVAEKVITEFGLDPEEAKLESRHVNLTKGEQDND